MTALTRNLPWFIRDFGISIIGKECYTSLVENLNINDVKCIKYSISKGLGIGIVVGGSIMKVPQLLLILKDRSARGLSLSAFALETLAYGITTGYAFRNEFPFSTYGENFFLTIQNIFITLLIILYSHPLSKPSSRNIQLLKAVVTTLCAILTLLFIPMRFLSLFQIATLPIALSSKVPQIRQNSRAHSTGQLSAFAVGSQIVGCLARVFTTATETGDRLVGAGFALALLLNLVLGAQMWMYWGNWEEKIEDEFGLGDKRGLGEEKESISKLYAPAPWQTVNPATLPNPYSNSHVLSSSPGEGKRRSRKLD